MEGEGVPAKESILVSVWNKIVEAYTRMKAKLNSLFRESITNTNALINEALVCLMSFVSSCCELGKVLSRNTTEIDNLFDKKLVMRKGSLLDGIWKLVGIVGPVALFLKIGSSPEMKLLKLKGFLDLAEGFIELLKYA